MPRIFRGLLPLVALLAFVGALALLSRHTELARSLELKTLDWRFRHLSVAARHDPRIVLVMVDQASLDHFERENLYWPWPRSLYGAALDLLKVGGARIAIFDILFTNPSPIGQSEDEAFGKALKRFGPVVMAMETGAEAQPTRAAPPPERFAVTAPAEVAASALTRRSARLPVPEIMAGSRLLGDVKTDA
ncbi:MAG: CHASE2 domain-containing protein, partial [Elusimicrobia bacterium]|nr:CHASE2 domain-containing protein [Elusimicrobiota bacterium]